MSLTTSCPTPLYDPVQRFRFGPDLSLFTLMGPASNPSVSLRRIGVFQHPQPVVKIADLDRVQEDVE